VKANLRRRLEVLEAAHGKTSLAMAYARAPSLMTDEEEELIEAICEMERITEIGSPNNIEEVADFPFLCFDRLSDLELDWVLFHIEYQRHTDWQDKTNEVELKNSREALQNSPR
jgi:hypothetical protein